MKAKRRYRVVQINAILAIAFITVLVSYFKSDALYILTDLEDVHQQAQAILIWISLNTFPEHFKGFQKGIIKALGLQN